MGVTLGTVMLLAAACGSADQVCLAYACANMAELTGSVSLPATTTQVDVSFCSQGKCHTGLIDWSAPTGARSGCTAMPQEDSEVCLKPNGDSFDLRAVLGVTGDNGPPPPSTEYHLTLVDHATGEMLLDVTRTMTYGVTREDNCHTCWSGGATL